MERASAPMRDGGSTADGPHDGRHGPDDDVGGRAGVAPDHRRARPRRGGAYQILAVQPHEMMPAIRSLGFAAVMSLRAASPLASDGPTKADPDDPALVAR